MDDIKRDAATNIRDELADRQFTPLGNETQEVAPPKPPEVTNAQMLAGAIDAGRNVFCFVCSIESPKRTLDADRLGELWGPVFDKHGWDLKKYMGEYAAEIAAVLGSLTMVLGMYKAAVAELDAKPKTTPPKDVDFPDSHAST